ncbi:MAG: LytTR family DNA-binding domain-containing protein, partial [Duncaniella sp.]|nr:LytTR family DNA-binding domain-containing protein [Duncaniella sp.]
SSVRVIFTTAYDNYAVEGFRVNALDYLLKPISYDEFLAAGNRALQWAELNSRKQEPGLTTSGQDHIIVKSEYKLVQIPIKDILYIEGLKDYVKIYTEGAEKSIMTLISMKALERSLPANKFMRVHRSYIVNLSKIKIIERNRIVFGKTSIPVSESYKQVFADYISSRTLTLRPDDDQE